MEGSAHGPDRSFAAQKIKGTSRPGAYGRTRHSSSWPVMATGDDRLWIGPHRGLDGSSGIRAICVARFRAVTPSRRNIVPSAVGVNAIRDRVAHNHL